MGSVNWLAVILAANLGAALRIVWYGTLFGQASLLTGRRAGSGSKQRVPWVGLIVVLAIPAAMLGHMFARLSPGKPWLYFMMSGGVALTFVIPALWIAYGQRDGDHRHVLIEGGYWLVTYLAMGAVFWALR